MRANSLLLACFLVLIWASTGSQLVLAAEKNSADDLLLEAFKAEKAGGDSVKVAEKFEAVVKADPHNYYALIKLGLMKMGDGKTASGTRPGEMDAAEYFLRAALARPGSPEAYLYLAELSYRVGDTIQGDRYLNMSKTLNRHKIYDRVCFTGWRYEDTGNYSGAVVTYARAALSPGSPFRDDTFLMKRLYLSALLSSPPYDWALPVTKLYFSSLLQSNVDEQVDKVVRLWKGKVSGVLLALGSAMSADSIVNEMLRDFVVGQLQRRVNLSDQIPDRHELPTVMYKLFFCNPDEIPKRRFSDPYEAFVKASPGTPEEHQRVLTELQDLKKKALAAIGNAPTAEERARLLFIWLKKNVLQEYRVLDGIPAKNVVEDKKYLCLSGAILHPSWHRMPN